MRVFCTKGDPPPLDEVVAWASRRGPDLRVDSEATEVNATSPSWTQAAVRYQDDRLPFLAEINWVDDEESDAALEIEEFKDGLEELPASPAKEKILNHLQSTTFVVATQIPTSDFEDEGYNAVGEFVRFFLEHNGGMIQADGEGFYNRETLILPYL
jgi:hypothetical protein